MTGQWTGADWQMPDDYASLVNIDRSLLMWEWLRRDPTYQRFSIGHATDPVHDVDGVRIFRLTDEMAAPPWGLRFR